MNRAAFTRCNCRLLFRAAIAAASASLLGMAPAAAQELKVLNYARTAQFESLDPVRQFDSQSHELVSLVYSTLLRYAYLERPFKLEPDLLERMPELSADRLTYTLRLRKGVFFHDNACFPGGKGRELVADDVLYSLRRFADANLNTKSWFTMDGAVVGLDAYRAATAKAGPGSDLAKFEIAGLRKVDSHTLTIRLTRPNALFLFALATSASSIVPREAVESYKARFDVNPVGTGPFTLKGVDRKGVLRFLKNPAYFGTYPTAGAPGDADRGLLRDAGKRLPLVDVVEMPLIEEAQPAMLKVLKGELDWQGMDRANFTKMVARVGDGEFRLKDEFAPKFDIYSTPGLDASYTTFNLRDELIGRNRLLRQAIARLVDSQAQIDVLLNGRGTPLNSIVPLDLPGSERDTGARFPRYDLAEAKRLLAEAGYPGGKGLPPLTVIYSGNTIATRNSADLDKAKFAAAGVQLKPVFSDWPTFLKNLESGNFQLAEGSWLADYPDAENFYQLLYGKNLAPGPNRAHFVNAAYDAAYEAARLIPNGPERLALFRKMNQILLDEMPVVLGSNSLRFGITQKWLRNFKRNVLAPEFMYLDVDMALKKKGLP